jgi:hypothetical protein
VRGLHTIRYEDVDKTTARSFVPLETTCCTLPIGIWRSRSSDPSRCTRCWYYCHDSFFGVSASEPTRIAYLPGGDLARQDDQRWTTRCTYAAPVRDPLVAHFFQVLTLLVGKRVKDSQGLLTAPSLNFGAIATTTEGYAPADLKDLVSRAVHRAAVRCSGDEGATTLTLEDFEKAKEGFVPVSLRDVPLQTSEVAWTDIGGASE